METLRDLINRLRADSRETARQQVERDPPRSHHVKTVEREGAREDNRWSGRWAGGGSWGGRDRER